MRLGQSSFVVVHARRISGGGVLWSGGGSVGTGCGGILGGLAVVHRILTEEEEIGSKGLRFAQGAAALHAAHDVLRRRGVGFGEEKPSKKSRNRRPITDQNVEGEQTHDPRENRQNDAQKSAELFRAQ